MIICPNCNNRLIENNKTYKCVNNHSFDIAKEGYINLLLNKPKAGDNLNMIKSRKNFLAKGYFDPLLNKILYDLKQLNLNNPNIIDLGCADGYYTNSIRAVYQSILGIDISKDAIKYASKSYNDILFIVANSKAIPIKDETVDLVISIFAPVFLDEIKRILKKDSYLLKVTPNSDHMLELKQILYEDVYLTKEKQIVDINFSLIYDDNLTYKVLLKHNEIINLFTMTPYSYKTAISEILNLQGIEELTITFDFNISIYKKKTS